MRNRFLGQYLLLALASCFALPCAAIGENIGTIVQTMGDARQAGVPAKLGDAVYAGNSLSTAGNAHIYIKTIDGGFLILWPNSNAQVAAYLVDAKQPANSRFKIELTRGVARSISGTEVKNSRENFRFNTPVAAIGVRGTDFTVFTDAQTTRISVAAGGVVVSGFGATCGPEGAGPCEGAAARELFASQTGQLIQVSREQPVPQMLRGTTLLPDTISPPRPDEPPKTSSASATSGLLAAGAATEPNLALLKLANLDLPTSPATGTDAAAPAVAPPLAVLPLAPPLAVLPLVPTAPALVWGRWQALVDKPADLNFSAFVADNKDLVINSYYAAGRSKESVWQSPSAGSVSFVLQNSQALVQADSTGAITHATLENGKLSVDFGKSSFSTQFDLVSANQRMLRQADGAVGGNGTVSNAGQYFAGNSIAVQGVLANEPTGLKAGYVFQSRIDAAHVASGVTYWAK